MKYLLKLSTDQDGTVIDADTLRRFIACAQGDGQQGDDIWPLARYVADRLDALLDAEG